MSRVFGHELKAARERAGLSQSKLARRAGFDHSYVSKLESADRDPSAESVRRLCDALGLEPEDALRDTMLTAAGFKPNSAAAMLSCAVLIDLDAAWLDADDVTRGFLARGVALLLDYAQARKAPARVVRLQTIERRSA